MTGPSLTTEGFILLRRPAAESFQTFTLFSAGHGSLRLLQRVPRKPSPSHVALDLFDETAVWLDAGAGGSWFVRESRLITRHPGIGQRYDRLKAASALATLIARNPVHEESRAAVHRLLRTAFTALETAERADIVFFKSLYCFARDEGHPLKQHWFPTLPDRDRAQVRVLLEEPLARQSAPPATVERLRRQLETYLHGHTEILVEEGGREKGRREGGNRGMRE